MHLPSPFRAAVGLVAAAAEEAKHLPDRAVELPMLVVSSALQTSLRAQQRYARLAARGDEVLNRRPPADEPPPWATFDEPVSTDELRKAALAQLDSLADGGTTSRMFEDLFGVGTPDDSKSTGGAGRKSGAATEDAAPRPLKAVPSKKAPRSGTPKTAAKETAAKETAAQETAAQETAATGGARDKQVSKPRHTASSKFDDADGT